MLVDSTGMKPKKYQPEIRKAVFESLEDRRLMSVSIGFADGVLSVNGTKTTNNSVKLTLINNGQDINAKDNGTSRTVALSAVRKIRVMGGNSTDIINVDPNITVKTVIRGAGGDDRIYGGGGKDDIKGGSGDDRIDGRGGDDSISGDDGDDMMCGGAGNDTLKGGTGTDASVSKLTTENGNVVHSPAPAPEPSSSGQGADPTPDPDTNDPGTNDPGSDNGGSTPTDSGPTNVPGNTSGSTQAVISLLNNSVIAGHAIHANAMDSALGAGTALTTKYEWDFGDPSGKYNTLVGFNAAHVYDQAGSYTITLKLTDSSGATSTAQATVNIAADTRKTIYVSQDGDDSNSGLSANQAVQSLTRAQALVGPNTRILFRRGDVWNTTTSALVLGQPHAATVTNTLIGAYGSGANPVFNYTGTIKNQLIRMRGDTSNVTIEDITFDSKYVAVGAKAASVPVNAVKLAGKNLTVRDCTFLNVGTAINGAQRPTGVLAQDNSAPLATGLRANFLWGEGSEYVVLGNTVANSTREHGVRFGNTGTDHILIAYNDITNLDRRSVDSGDYNKKTIVLQNGTYAYLFDNKFSDGPVDVSTAITTNSSDGVASRGPLCRFQWVVVEGNDLHNTEVNVEPNAAHVLFRDNFIQSNDHVFNIEGHDPMDPSRTVDDVSFIHNTGITTGPGGAFIFATSDATHIVVTDNTYASPSSDRIVPMQVRDSDLSMFTLISHNVWPTGSLNYVKAGDPAASGYKTPSQWESYSQVQDDVFRDVTLPTGS